MTMDLLEKFRTILGKKYLSHVHTTYTDGINSVEDYCNWASDHNYDAVVFSEHVRKNLSYDFSRYIQDIDNVRQKFPSLEIWRGIEAKVLPDGLLDIPDDILHNIDVLFFACHAFSGDVEIYKKAFLKVFQDKKWKNHSRVWAHPGLYFKNRDTVRDSGTILAELIETATAEDVFIENNLRYNALPRHLLSACDQSMIITGYDAHSIESLQNYAI